ncbi:MAG: glycosyltransferase [Oscillospiraceae bacterium]|nr:glycosyltransferase [Oscillospiraceae bacterium]
MKKILFTINTLSRAGAETALLALLQQLDPEEYDISLFVLMGQGELISELPPYVHVLNDDYDSTSVLHKSGKKKMMIRVLRSLLNRGTVLRLFPYFMGNLCDMLRRGTISVEKLLWRALSDGAQRCDTTYDLAVAYLEGGSTYYVANHVNAVKKAAFVHIDYQMAGYTRKLDLDCYREFDKIFTVSDEVKDQFNKSYPEYAHKTEVFHNILNVPEIRRKSLLSGGFTDDYDGTRILTIGRLTAQKAFEVSIDALKLLKDAGGKFRWYVLGEGNQRSFLEQKISELGLEEDFILCGAVDNPYPYLLQTDLYVHASRFEGKSIAIQEAQILGCAVLVSDCSGNREQVSDGVDGRICPFTPEAIRDGVLWYMEHPDEKKQCAVRAGQKYENQTAELNKLTALFEEDGV